ncbi:M23 family metallopeptidase [Geobacter sp. DSM 9736]|uniref:peptidoglycan DD-metalloendopeptidase family protein n=1 Tax=Geobacter sp. DSM 9736 TaxID=1277350 RepID=UPI000B50EC32|nr:M23 family metallopeptidase [Geobacter sp. DSM 9736]SNB45571.1 protein of unknown function [Geobacter sp. DSM 9736]
MKRAIETAVMVTCISMLAAYASADIYRYVDDNGSICFTDAPTRPAVRILSDKLPSKRDHQADVIGGLRSGIRSAKKRSIFRVHGEAYAEEKLIAPVEGTVTSVFGYRHDPLDGKMRLHQGVDIAVPTGTPVRAAARGVVAFSGNHSGYGNVVAIEHEDGTTTLYGHNSVNLAAEGDYVRQDTPIALSGSTGRSTGPHLHFEAWKKGVNVTSSLLREWISQPGGRLGDTIAGTLAVEDGSVILTNSR